MNLAINILKKGLLLFVVLNHFSFYMFLPNVENNPPLAAHEMTALYSFDHYFIEKVLKVPDRTPGKSDDDIGRLLQIVSVEDFGFNKTLPEPAQLHPPPVFNPSFIQIKLTSIPYDIPLPPPRM